MKSKTNNLEIYTALRRLPAVFIQELNYQKRKLTNPGNPKFDE